MVAVKTRRVAGFSRAISYETNPPDNWAQVTGLSTPGGPSERLERKAGVLQGPKDGSPVPRGEMLTFAYRLDIYQQGVGDGAHGRIYVLLQELEQCREDFAT